MCIGCTMTSAQCSQLPDSIFSFLVPSGGENIHFLVENRESLLACPAVRKGETFKQHVERLTINRITSEGKTDVVSQKHPGLQNSPGSGVIEAMWMWALPLYAGMCSFAIINDMKIWSIMNMLTWITEEPGSDSKFCTVPTAVAVLPLYCFLYVGLCWSCTAFLKASEARSVLSVLRLQASFADLQNCHCFVPHTSTNQAGDWVRSRDKWVLRCISEIMFVSMCFKFSQPPSITHKNEIKIHSWLDAPCRPELALWSLPYRIS